MRRSLATLLLVPALCARAHAAPLARPTAALVDAAVREQMAALHLPGVSIAIGLGGEVAYAAGYGKADVENDVLVTPSTMFRLASISKTLTAIAVMQLVEQKKLDLDAPIQTYVPSFPKKAWPVTARDLLGHLAGVRHYAGRHETDSTKHYAGCTQGLSMFDDDPLLQEPRTRYTYSSFGFNLVGCAIEAPSGQPYVDYVRDRVLVPAGAKSTRPDDGLAIIPHRAQGYAYSAERGLRNSGLVDTSSKVPSGGWIGTADDLVRVGLALMAGKLLGPTTLAAMWTSQRTKAGEETGYGYGWSVTTKHGELEVGHAGRQQRVSTYFYLRPGKKLAVAVLSNLEETKLEELAVRIGEIVAGKLGGDRRPATGHGKL